MRFFLCVALYGWFTAIASANSHAFDKWKSHGWTLSSTETVYVHPAKQDLAVTFFTDNQTISSVEMYFDEVAQASYRFLSSEVSFPGDGSGKCYNWRLVVYELSESHINSRDIMYWYPWRDASMRIYGAYDSKHRNSKNTAVIVIRNDMPSLKRKQILAHELTHYWYDMCVANGEAGEKYAKAAENLF